MSNISNSLGFSLNNYSTGTTSTTTITEINYDDTTQQFIFNLSNGSSFIVPFPPSNFNIQSSFTIYGPNSTSKFLIQNSTSSNIFEIDTSGGNINVNGNFLINGSYIGNIYQTIANMTDYLLKANAYIVPNVDEQCFTVSNASGNNLFFINTSTGILTLQNASGSAILYSNFLSSNPELIISSNIFLIQPHTNSSDTFQIRDQFGTLILNTDTTNNIITNYASLVQTNPLTITPATEIKIFFKTIIKSNKNSNNNSNKIQICVQIQFK